MNTAETDTVKTKAQHIRLVILDVDGVLTNGDLLFDDQGREYKTFNSQDGHGIRMLHECHIAVAIITGRQSDSLKHRMRDLGIKQIFQGYRDKYPAFIQLLVETRLQANQIAYIGDDLPDLPVMSRVGFAIAVQNAHPFVKKQANWVTRASGGSGAVREAIDFILKAQGLLDDKQASYLR